MSRVGVAPRIFLSVAEQSADEHAAGLIRAVQQRRNDAEFFGLAGPRCRAAGCLSLGDLTDRAAMLLGVVGRAPLALRALSRVDRYLARHRVDAAVLVDSGTLHLPLAWRMAARRIPVFYFIAPQTWASREWRVRALRKRVTRLGVIFPFEEAYFRGHGVAATYVGHPLFERLEGTPVDQSIEAALKGDASPVIALMPGSRVQVVREVLPGQLDVVEAVAARYRRVRFLLAPANDRILDEIRRLCAARRTPPPIQIVRDRRAEVFRAADLVLAASGTVTLEAAFHRTPMIVMYNARGARWFYPLLRGWMIKTTFLSLPNILAGRRIVPEFMPWYRNTTEIAMTAIELLSSPALLDRMRADLDAIVRPLSGMHASDRAAEELLDMIESSRSNRGTAGASTQ